MHTGPSLLDWFHQVRQVDPHWSFWIIREITSPKDHIIYLGTVKLSKRRCFVDVKCWHASVWQSAVCLQLRKH